MGKSVSLPEPLRALVRELEPGAMTNFYGGPGTGKTNVCLLAALECANSGGKVIYIDTEGGFSEERARQVAGSGFESAMKRIELLQPKSFEEQGKAIRALKDKKADLVIVDSAVALYRIECAGDGKQTEFNREVVMKANRELSKQLSIISSIARERGIPVLITAHTFKNWDNGEDEIVGGDAIRYWSKATVYLEKTGKTSERKATLKKHRSMPEGGSVKFMLVEDGIKPSGFKLF